MSSVLQLEQHVRVENSEITPSLSCVIPNLSHMTQNVQHHACTSSQSITSWSFFFIYLYIHLHLLQISRLRLTMSCYKLSSRISKKHCFQRAPACCLVTRRSTQSTTHPYRGHRLRVSVSYNHTSNPWSIPLTPRRKHVTKKKKISTFFDGCR